MTGQGGRRRGEAPEPRGDRPSPGPRVRRAPSLTSVVVGVGLVAALLDALLLLAAAGRLPWWAVALHAAATAALFGGVLGRALHLARYGAPEPDATGWRRPEVVAATRGPLPLAALVGLAWSLAAAPVLALLALVLLGPHQADQLVLGLTPLPLGRGLARLTFLGTAALGAFVLVFAAALHLGLGQGLTPRVRGALLGAGFMAGFAGLPATGILLAV